MNKLRDITIRKILNSRGLWTIELRAILPEGKEVHTSVPEGKSIGAGEVGSVPAETAITQIESVRSEILAEAYDAQDEFDAVLHRFMDEGRLGGNTALALSLLYLKSHAIIEDKPLWKHVAQISDSKPGFPSLYANLINGGLHASNGLSIQEYLLIDAPDGSMEERIERIRCVYLKVGTYLREHGQGSFVGDEGGYAPLLASDEEPFGILKRFADDYPDLSLGMDAAGADYKQGWYERVQKEYGLVYIEDPYKEADIESFVALNEALGDSTHIAGDDLTVTNPEKIEEMAERRAINAVILKPNQIGTVSKTIEALQAARKAGLQIIFSHRSGETNDAYIADFAVGCGVDGFKSGAPARGERVAKYNRLLEIESEMEK